MEILLVCTKPDIIFRPRPLLRGAIAGENARSLGDDWFLWLKALDAAKIPRPGPFVKKNPMIFSIV